MPGRDWSRYNPRMPKPHPGRKGFPVSLHPLTPDQAVEAMFKIKPADVRRVLASKPTSKYSTKKKK